MICNHAFLHHTTCFHIFCMFSKSFHRTYSLCQRLPPSHWWHLQRGQNPAYPAGCCCRSWWTAGNGNDNVKTSNDDNCRCIYTINSVITAILPLSHGGHLIKSLHLTGSCIRAISGKADCAPGVAPNHWVVLDYAVQPFLVHWRVAWVEAEVTSI